MHCALAADRLAKTLLLAFSQWQDWDFGYYELLQITSFYDLGQP